MKIKYIILLLFLFTMSIESQLRLIDEKNQSTTIEMENFQINQADNNSISIKEKTTSKINTIPNSRITVDDWVVKYQILRPDGINSAIQSAYIRIKNNCYGEIGTKELKIIAYSSITTPEFKHNLPIVDDTNPIIISQYERDFVFSTSFTVNNVGNYQDSIIFTTENAINCDNVCVLNIKAIASNLYLFHNDEGTETTDDLDFGTITSSNPKVRITKKIKLVNNPNIYGFGCILTIHAINWGTKSTTDSAKIGYSDNEFYINEQKMFKDLRQSGYPLLLGIGQSVDVEVTYYTNQYNTEHRNTITIESDADESGVSGKFNNTITLLGNAKSSSVINKQTTSNFFPNPANNTITFDKSIKGNIEIFNLLGEKVRDFESNLKSTFDISNLQNGVYIIKYKIDGQYYSEKLSVSR